MGLEELELNTDNKHNKPDPETSRSRAYKEYPPGTWEEYNTTFRRIERSPENSVGDQLRLNKFEEGFSPEMKKALSVVGRIFQGVSPWAIHASTAAFLESETEISPDDIDIAFSNEDVDKVWVNFQKMKDQGLITNLKKSEVRNFADEPNGCTRIEADVILPDGKTINIEAYGQNTDPEKAKNGITNIGLDQTGVNVYLDEDGVEINFADREEMLKFYVQVAMIELQKYLLEYSFLDKVKNKFPMRLERILSMVKRIGLEKNITESGGDIKNIKESDLEDVTILDINAVINQFLKLNQDHDLFDRFEKHVPHPEAEHKALEPMEVLQKRYTSFIGKKLDNYFDKKSKPGLVSTHADHTREKVVSELSAENRKDMDAIASYHKNLKFQQGKLTQLLDQCKKKCTEEMKGRILSGKVAILDIAKGANREITKIKEKYDGYLEQINFADNRDFIPFFAIKEVMDRYVIPALDIAQNLEKEVSQINVNNIEITRDSNTQAIAA